MTAMSDITPEQDQVDPKQQRMAALGEAIAALDEYVADPSNEVRDRALRGTGPSGTTFGVGALLIVLILTTITCSIVIQDQGTLLGLYVIAGIIFFSLLVFFFVSMHTDRVVRHMQSHDDPCKAFKGFFKAAKGLRTKALMVALAPPARETAAVRPLTFTQKIPSGEKPDGFNDTISLKKYWQYITKGPSSHSRSITLKKVSKVADMPGDVAVIEAHYYFTSFPQSAALFVGALILVLIQKRETKIIRKLMARRGGRWYLMSGEFEGDVDLLAASV